MVILFLYERQMIPKQGGVERVSMLLAREFVRRGYTIRFLSVGPKSWNSEEYSFEIPQDHIFSDLPDQEERLKNYYEILKPDVVIIQSYNPCVVSTIPFIPEETRRMMVYHNRPYAILGQEKFVKSNTPWKSLRLKGKLLKMLALVSPSIFQKMDMRIKRRSLSALVNVVDDFILLSNRFVGRVVENTPGIDRRKIIAINNPNTFEITSEDFSSQKEKLVLFVGRLSNPQKNVTGFLKVWKMFNDRFPDWQAIILGDGEDREYIKGYAIRIGVKNLIFAGAVTDVAPYYSKASVLCLTSAYEGWGMVLTEAMSYGCVPVLYNSYESAEDIVESGKNGYLIPPYNEEEMVERISELASSPDMCLQMAQAGKEKIGFFSVKNIVDQWEKTIGQGSKMHNK